MAFTVNFYKFAKRENSTARPSGSGRSFSCILKENSSVIDPVIVLDLGTDTAPDFNYAYIPEYNRYYAVTEWNWVEHRLWSASLSCDVLATYRTEIGNKDLYILRSSAEYNGKVVDTIYPTTADPRSYIDRVTSATLSNKAGDTLTVSNFWDVTYGYYYLGVVGDNRTGVSCYCLTYNGFKVLLQALTAYAPSDMSDVSTGIAKQLANPMQYIVFCYWLPFAPIGAQFRLQTIINFGYYPITITGTLAAAAELDPIADATKVSISFNIRKHPQAASRGAYLNQAPYTNYRLQILPFGVFSLDGSMMIEAQTLRAEFWADIATGQAQVSIWATNTLLAKQKTQLGVPINISQAVVDYTGAATGVLSGLGSGVANALSGDFFGAFSGMLTGIGSAAQAMQPKVSQLGGGGDYLPFTNDPPALLTDFYLIADEFNSDLGRPLCEIRKPSAIPGFILCAEGEVPISGTAREAAAVKGYLERGFFYE